MPSSNVCVVNDLKAFIPYDASISLVRTGFMTIDAPATGSPLSVVTVPCINMEVALSSALTGTVEGINNNIAEKNTNDNEKTDKLLVFIVLIWYQDSVSGL